MVFLNHVSDGRFGLRFAIPERLRPTDEADNSAMLIDQERGVVLHLSRYDLQLDLSPEHRKLLRRDIKRHTRDLFDRFHRDHIANRGPRPGPAQGPRTADPTWSPVVSVEPVRLGEHRALSVIHRMSYAPGDEQIMGHLLVPLRRGLFEFRIIAYSKMTGVRESMLGLKALTGGAEPKAAMARLRQRDIDDPSLDEKFPDHPLSLVRAELRELLAGGGIAVLDPAPAAPSGEVVLDELGCAIMPPPRYVQIHGDRYKGARFSRVSFAGSDGVQILSVVRVSDQRLPPGRERKELVKLAGMIARLPMDDVEVHGEAQSLPDEDGRAQASAYRSYDEGGGNAPQHTAFHLFTDDEGRPMMISVGTAQCVPRDEMFDEVDAVVDSWRPLDDGSDAPARGSSREKKPWWQLW